MKFLSLLWTGLLVLAASSCSSDRPPAETTSTETSSHASQPPVAPPPSSLPADLSSTSASGEECLKFIRSLPPEYRFGFITVPENWDNPEGQKTEVFYYYKFTNPSHTPVIYFNGGPGVSSHDEFKPFSSQKGLESTPLVFMDQRGTGCSKKVQNPSNALQFKYYTSPSIVKDAEAVRKTILGPDRKWKIYGESYGGFIVRRYIMLYPKSIEEAFSAGFGLSSDHVDFLKKRLQATNHVLEVYFQTYPEDRQRISELRQTLDQKNVTVFIGDTPYLVGSEFADLFSVFVSSLRSWPLLNQILTLSSESLSQRDHLIKQIFSNISSMFGMTNLNLLSLSDAIQALEVFGNFEVNFGKAHGQLEAEGANPSQWLVNAYRYLQTSSQKTKEATKAITQAKSILLQHHNPIQIQDLASLLKTNPQLKFTIYLGGLDCLVPPEAVQDELKALGSLVQSYVFPNAGHDLYDEPLIISDITR